MRFAGPALTVEVRPGDNLMIHAALAMAQPGDVMVIDGKGDLGSALMGEIMSQQAVALGVVGGGHRRRGARQRGHPRTRLPDVRRGPEPERPDQERGRPAEPPHLDRWRHRQTRATWWWATPMA
jgi:hypothetical protein